MLAGAKSVGHYTEVVVVPGQTFYSRSCAPLKAISLSTHPNCKAEVGYIKSSGVNYRERPTTASASLGMFNRCDKVLIRGKPFRGEDGRTWSRVQKDAKDYPGFVDSRYVAVGSCGSSYSGGRPSYSGSRPKYR